MQPRKIPRASAGKSYPVSVNLGNPRPEAANLIIVEQFPVCVRDCGEQRYDTRHPCLDCGASSSLPISASSDMADICVRMSNDGLVRGLQKLA